MNRRAEHGVILTQADRERIAGYLHVISREADGTERRAGYESEHPFYTPHPVEPRYCGACMSVATLCDCHWSHCLPIGVRPPAGPYALPPEPVAVVVDAVAKREAA